MVCSSSYSSSSPPSTKTGGTQLKGAWRGGGGQTPSSADVWYCNNAALFPTVTILLRLPGIVARAQCHRGNARLETSFFLVAPAEPLEPYNPTQPIPTYTRHNPSCPTARRLHTYPTAVIAAAVIRLDHAEAKAC